MRASANNLASERKLNFRPIQEQIREEKEKKTVALKKPNEKIDERLMNMMSKINNN